MKIQKLIIAVALLLTFSYVRGQELAKHIIQRGETLEYIARIYGISIDELKEANPDIDIYHTGITLNIPPYMKNDGANDTNMPSLSAISYERLQAYRNNCDAADFLFNSGNYKKAQKMYKQIISEYRNELPCSDAVYNNALCSYNRGKWKSAIEDLSVVVDNKNCSNAQRDHCKKLLEKAYTYREEQLENRTDFWSGLLTTAATVGTAVALTHSQSDLSSVDNSRNKTTVENESGFSYNNNSSSTNTPSSPGKSSISGSSNSSCRSLKVGNGKWYCANTGRCGMCNGDGMMDNGIKVNQFKCTLCGGTGKCKYCQ